MKKNLVYCIGLAVFAMVLTIAGPVLAECEVKYDGGKLEIKCDGDADNIAVTENAGDLLVGIPAGNESSVGSAGDLKDIVIESEGGADTVLINLSYVSDSVEVKSGEGNDSVTIKNVAIGNDLKIETDKGKDFVFLKNVDVSNTIDVKTGEKKDIVKARGTVHAGNDAKFDGEGGKDIFKGTSHLDAGNKVELKSFKTKKP